MFEFNNLLNNFMDKVKKGISGEAIAVGAAAATAIVAAAGAYWFYGSKDAMKHRKTARSWMLKARGDVLEAVEIVVEKVGEIDKEKYMNIVEDVLKRYSKLAHVTKEDVMQTTKDMKDAWQHMQKIRKNTITSNRNKVIKRSR